MRNEKADAARSKPSHGQDEVRHTFTNPATGETYEGTNREWREKYRAEGWTRSDKDADEGSEDALASEPSVVVNPE